MEPNLSFPLGFTAKRYWSLYIAKTKSFRYFIKIFFCSMIDNKSYFHHSVKSNNRQVTYQYDYFFLVFFRVTLFISLTLILVESGFLNVASSVSILGQIHKIFWKISRNFRKNFQEISGKFPKNFFAIFHISQKFSRNFPKNSVIVKILPKNQ